MSLNKPFSQACHNNREPILAILKTHLKDSKGVLEIGSGTGQHAVYFAERLPHLYWQTSDLFENHPGINAWLADYCGLNVAAPIILNAADTDWPAVASNIAIETVFTANTLHIMAWPEVQKFISNLADIIPVAGHFIAYGPFNYKGQFTSDSNARFNDWLKQQAPHRAIRDIEAIIELAEESGLELQHDHELPANNRCLVFLKTH